MTTQELRRREIVKRIQRQRREWLERQRQQVRAYAAYDEVRSRERQLKDAGYIEPVRDERAENIPF